jgi:uncharacterized repeat protein (TIGR03809 family)
MTHRTDVARGRDLVARWRVLAEQRLDYLTELFETGRWRRFHSERAFLENIQEAKTAVEFWRGLSTREASRDNSAVDLSWLGHTGAPLPGKSTSSDRAHRPPSQPVQIAAELPAQEVSIVPETSHVNSDEAPSAPAMENALALTLDAIAERYPLLRNAL